MKFCSKIEQLNYISYQFFIQHVINICKTYHTNLWTIRNQIPPTSRAFEPTNLLMAIHTPISHNKTWNAFPFPQLCPKKLHKKKSHSYEWFIKRKICTNTWRNDCKVQNLLQNKRGGNYNHKTHLHLDQKQQFM